MGLFQRHQTKFSPVTLCGKPVKMSGGLEKLQLQEDDVLKFLASGMHLGAQNCETVMQSYVYARKSDGIHILNLRKTWEKLLLAARIIAGIENPADVCVLSSRPYGTRAVLKFAAHTGASPIAEDWSTTPVAPLADDWMSSQAPAKVVEWGAEDPAQGNWEQTDQTAGW